MNTPFDSVEAAIEDIRNGKMVIVTDDENRENEGDLVCAAEKVTPEDAAVIRESKALGMLSIPGFFTASEAFTAIHAGADYLKLFPAVLGPGYVKDLKAVVKKPILAVGGVNAANLPDFMKVCAGAGIGSALYKAGKSLADLDRDAAAMVAAVK